jgi:peptidyl-prolyl cis-trans isomerase C
MPKARARHILVESEVICQDLKEDIEKGEDFAHLAQFFSSCSSNSAGGDLGEFEKGNMVPEFDEIVFSGEVGKLYGPVKTKFGYHLIEILSRDN